jgi:hypothetical protein
MHYEVKIPRDTPSHFVSGVDVYTLKNGSESLSPLTRKHMNQGVFEIAPLAIGGQRKYSADEGVVLIEVDDQTKKDMTETFDRKSLRSLNSLRPSSAF